MEKKLGLFVISIHLFLLFFSCYRTNTTISELDDESRIQFIMANVFRDKSGLFHMTWETTSKEETLVEVFNADTFQPIDYKKETALVKTKEKVTTVERIGKRFLHLVINKQDTLIIDLKKYKSLGFL